MRLSANELKALLDREAARRNEATELSYERPDPLLVASRHRDERIALICALFGYGSAKQIVAFLDRLDFSLLEVPEERISEELQALKYRFQTSEDIAALFIALRRLGKEQSLGEIVRKGYEARGEIRDGLWALITALREAYPRKSRGYDFLVGKVPENPERCAPFKRYMMYFRWMVRRDALDLGLWEGIDPADLIIPLDTHTHAVSLRLGLLERKSYDMRAALELTETLRRFDPADPVRYDFALYRIGQEKIAVE
ncbi:MAG TPA: TIGR02757 family protein [Nitratifractor salsuginis]|uniref:TIGR02757 family protein n=1 Tax=Nitratifractor salsuginis TaxID=269261 RepID=A0A7V2WKZ3_9BACT|nr:TIGR02757 family protein [Nitratifractor salsuginis]